jgi:23S rRNA (cytosine1962-C5)-methyltransferase
MREVYRDRWLVVVDKPSGLPTQAGRDGRPGVFERLRAQEAYVGLHHRLDTPASGLVLLSLDRAANVNLSLAFKQHTIERTYAVWVLGRPGQGSWRADLDDKAAITHFESLAPGRISRLTVRLETGRTHQIRRHAQTAGHPVIGDRRHGGAAGTLHPRLALHAWKLHLKHPVTGEDLHLEAPIPADLERL